MADTDPTETRISILLDFDLLRPRFAAIDPPCIDPERMFRMLPVGYLHGIRSETRPKPERSAAYEITGVAECY
jgi:hypothetical protein